MEEEVWDQNEEVVDVDWSKENQDADALEEGNWNKDDFAESVPAVEPAQHDSTFTPDRRGWERPPPMDQENEEPSAKYVGNDIEYEGRVSRRSSYNKLEREDFRAGIRKPAIGDIMTTNVGFGQALRRMVREAWGAEKPEGRGTLRSPISKVRFTQTNTVYCTTTDECMKACRDIQKYYMDLGFPDTPYNFLIGGDGVVYHGRGWGKQADRSPAFHKLKKSCVDIAYIGDFVDKKIPYEMISAATDFLKYGLKVARLTPFFQSFTYLSDTRRS